MTIRLNEHPISARIFGASIVSKIGGIFGLLALVYSIFLFTTSHMTSQLIGVSSAIDEAGTLRMRVYKIGQLIAQLTGPPAEKDLQILRQERDQWMAVLDGLRFGTAGHGPIEQLSPVIGVKLREIQNEWNNELAPLVDRVLHAEEPELQAIQKEYLVQADRFVLAVSAMVHTLEQDVAARTNKLYTIQIIFWVFSIILMALAVLFLNQQIRVRLGRLATRADRLVPGEGEVGVPIAEADDMARFTKTFERLMEGLLHSREEIQALHATGQEISSLGTLSLDEVLKRIVDRAADLVGADQAALFLRHPFMDCWMIEASSGEGFNKTRKGILLFEQTPFVSQVYESRRPTTIDDLSCYPDRPVGLRDEFGAKSFLGVPLLTPHGCIGVLALMSTRSLRHFLESDVHVAQQFASYAAVTVENARLFDAVESESKLLKEKLAAVEREVAELTHEVKAPAGRVAEFASWIEKDYGHRLDEKGIRYLHWIQKEGRDLASLASRTLDWSRITQVPTPIEPVDMRAVVQEVLELLDQDRSKKGVHVTVAPDLPRLACQRIHAKQILENLVSNAIKYTGTQPHSLIEIGWGVQNEHPFFFVRDNGRGIEPAMTERIFLPFQRLATDQPGSGIGLSIVKTVLEHYGGKIWVESTPGQGSTFYFTLPVLPDDAVPRNEPMRQDARQEAISSGQPHEPGGGL